MKNTFTNKKEIQEAIVRLKDLSKRSRGYNKKLVDMRIHTYELFLEDIEFEDSRNVRREALRTNGFESEEDIIEAEKDVLEATRGDPMEVLM